MVDLAFKMIQVSLHCKASSSSMPGVDLKLRFKCVLCGMTTWAILLLLVGCESDSSTPEIKPPATPQAVPSADVSKIQAWKDASLIASKSAGREALVGGGTSMNPVYGDNTMLVVQPIDYDSLKAGMTVVYLNKRGLRVAHQLVSKEERGWRAQGINNEVEDYDYVTPDNLIGVVYASLVSEDPNASDAPKAKK